MFHISTFTWLFWLLFTCFYPFSPERRKASHFYLILPFSHNYAPLCNNIHWWFSPYPQPISFPYSNVSITASAVNKKSPVWGPRKAAFQIIDCFFIRNNFPHCFVIYVSPTRRLILSGSCLESGLGMHSNISFQKREANADLEKKQVRELSSHEPVWYVAPIGFEPMTLRVWTECSGQLSYGAIWLRG